jgi:hypothetical protein
MKSFTKWVPVFVATTIIIEIEIWLSGWQLIILAALVEDFCGSHKFPEFILFIKYVETIHKIILWPIRIGQQ